MPNIVYIATSLDGYIAREDGSIDWLTNIPNPDSSDYGFADFMKRIDAIILGRKSYETVLSFNQWPYTKPVFVLSQTLNHLPAELESKAEIVHGNLQDLVRSLAGRGFHTLYIDGGKTIRAFLKEDLIDELIITRIPLLLGAGIPLFDKDYKELAFEHAGTEIYHNTLVKTRYIRKR